MSRAVANPEEGRLQEKIDQTVIAPGPHRRRRAAAFQLYLIGASVLFIGLAVLAHSVGYFPIDLAVTKAVQSYHGDLFARTMYGVSWIGFIPQVDILCVGVALMLFMIGLRWEAVMSLLAASGVIVGAVVKLVVYRPRPSADLVRVFEQLPTSGFPSGHVLEFTAFGGFLAFLVFTLVKSSWGRTVALISFTVLIVLMGLSRIYQGQHWFSDVMGAYLLGSLWLALTIKIYRWGKTRFFVRQPVAPQVGPSTSSA